jgi:hypothetical protein
MRKQRAKPKQGGKHLNVKYLVEELDYIRYHNVDLSQPWELVKVNFCAEFSHTKVADKRKVPGLQGGYYRQNKQLPHIVEGQLVFMENGHVEPACVQKREQKAKKHLFTLVYLFPERAQYPWMLPKDRQRAAELRKFLFDAHTTFSFLSKYSHSGYRES